MGRGVISQSKLKKLVAIAHTISLLSKDVSSKVGALLVDEDGAAGPWGYNGACRGSTADEDDRMTTRPEKYFWAEHAERNAIYAAARSGYATKNSTLIVTHPPCMDCARAIVQAGIKEVYCTAPSEEFKSRWQEHIFRTKVLFEECGVKYEWI